METNDDNALCRFEFMEMLVRIAKGKFIDYGSETSLSAALERLIQEYVLPMGPRLVPWNSFRVEQMHANEVNDLLEVNLGGLRKLFDALARSKNWVRKRNLLEFYNTPKEPSVDQIVAALKGLIPDVFEKEILQAFYLSKMTVAKESEHCEYEYTFLKWPEFCEFIARLGYFKYNDTY